MSVISNQYIQGINQTTGNGVPVHNGIAGDRYTDLNNGFTYQYTTSWQLVSYSVGATSINTDGNVLYVSSVGSDTDLTRSGHVGNPTKPFLTLKAARDAAISGDLIYVHPQYFIFDNTNGSYDLIIDDLNLWKDGVTYYWSPGCKLKMIARYNLPRVDMWLFKPKNYLTAYETCTSLGYLEYEHYQDPANGGAWGACSYFVYDGTTTGTDYGCTFYSQTKSMVGTGNVLVGVSRGNSASTSSIFNLTFVSDYESHTYLSGLSGGDFNYSIFGSTAVDLPMNIVSIVKDRVCSNKCMVSVRNKLGLSSYVYFGGDSVKQTSYGWIAEPRVTSTATINIDIKKIYVSAAGTNNALMITDQNNNGSLGTVFNVKGDIIPIDASSTTKSIITLAYNTTVNYEGDIFTNTNSGTGNIAILYTNSVNSIINMKGNIIYRGASTNTNVIFKTVSLGKINFSGNISGNFSNTIAQCGTGTIEIYNSNIKSGVTGSTSYVLANGNTSLGTININNSIIELINSTNPISDGSYVKSSINNSRISNIGGNGFSNSTTSGSLQLLNSIIITGSTSINYSNTSPVISSNTTTNKPYNVNVLYGSIDTITELIL